jgi:hypothetical protein
MARIWTEEQKAIQAAKVRTWRPWEKSTGARTPEGKAKVSKNVLVGKAKRENAIAVARQELAQAQAKLRRLLWR